MKKNIFTKHFITAVLCCCFTALGIFGFFGGDFSARICGEAKAALAGVKSFYSGEASYADSAASVKDALDSAETAAAENVLYRYPLISYKGAFMNAANQYFVENNGVLKLKSGSLDTFSISTADERTRERALEQADAVITYCNYVKSCGGNFVYVYVPPKNPRQDSLLPAGFPDVYNDLNDIFLEKLAEAGVDCIDLREYYKDFSAEEYSELFYKTDHHWTVETSFDAAGIIAGHLNDSYGIDVDLESLDRANWSEEVYESYMLGSLGRKVGAGYAGVEDFTFLYPDFETDFSVTIANTETWSTSGSFNYAVTRHDLLNRYDSLYERAHYNSYGSNYARFTVTNNMAQNDSSLLIIKDSAGVPVVDFMAAAVKNTDSVDPRVLSANLGYDCYDIYNMDVPDAVVVIFGGVINADRFDFGA